MEEKKSVNADQKEKEESNEALIWIGLGAVTVAAVAATIYVVQKNRTNELNAMRYDAPSSGSRMQDMLVSARDNFTSFWESTTSSFTKLNNFVQRVLNKENTVPLFPEVVEPVDSHNEDELAGSEEMV
jgi:hypothetical protein